MVAWNVGGMRMEKEENIIDGAKLRQLAEEALEELLLKSIFMQQKLLSKKMPNQSQGLNRLEVRAPSWLLTMKSWL
jgi:hypothetical protein